MNTPISHFPLYGKEKRGKGDSSKPKLSLARLAASSSSIGWYLSAVPFPLLSEAGSDFIFTIGEYSLAESVVESTI